MIDFETWLSHTIPEHMLRRGLTILKAKLKPIRLLLEQRRVPEQGWGDDVIEFLFTILSWMDSDKDSQGAHIGEREARVASPLISKLAAGFCHGVGRSGNIAAPQPKAAGTSLTYFLTNRLALDVLQRTGAPNLKSACTLPVATGVAIGLATSVARDETKKNEVVYPRVDHRSPVKGMKLVGMRVKTVESIMSGDAVTTPIESISSAVNKNTAAIVSTTTFFPPREHDDVKAIAKLASEKDVFHIINNAYGVQSRQIMKLVRGAIDAGRVDAVVQSTDKNFLTPVGGSIVASSTPDFVEAVSKTYAGRASAAPIVQFLAAVLSMGIRGYEELRDLQEKNHAFLLDCLEDIATKHGERLLNVFNPVAAAMTLNKHKAKKVGHNLYTLRVTGPRVLEETDFGVCCERYHSPYITVNAAIGCTRRDIEKAIKGLDKTLSQTKK